MACLRAAAAAQPAAPTNLGQAALSAEVQGDYLAGLPLENLWATRERPLFLPTRRAPIPPPPPVPVEAPPPVTVPETPHLVLLGTIQAGNKVRSALLFDEIDQTSINLKIGADRRGWVLQSISVAGVTLRKAQQAATLSFAPPQPVTEPARPASAAGGGTIQVAP